jgi:hypothetical protein
LAFDLVKLNTGHEDSSMHKKEFLRIILGILATMLVTLILSASAWAQTTFKTLYRFKGGKDGKNPFAGLVFDTAGNLYGTTYYGGARKYYAQGEARFSS